MSLSSEVIRAFLDEAESVPCSVSYYFRVISADIDGAREKS
jgi:hypothetical protein